MLGQVTIEVFSHLKQMVGELVCDELVPPGQLLAGEPQQDPVHGAEVVQVAGVVHLLVQLHVEGHLAELLVTPVNAPLHQRVAESRTKKFVKPCPQTVSPQTP